MKDGEKEARDNGQSEVEAQHGAQTPHQEEETVSRSRTSIRRQDIHHKLFIPQYKWDKAPSDDVTVHPLQGLSISRRGRPSSSSSVGQGASRNSSSHKTARGDQTLLVAKVVRDSVMTHGGSYRQTYPREPYTAKLSRINIHSHRPPGEPRTMSTQACWQGW